MQDYSDQGRYSMPRDFTLERYSELLSVAVSSIYTPLTVQDYLTAPAKRCLILRHDVDRVPERALKMARVEQGMDVTSTYYFRHKPGVFDPSIMSEIADMGHEIGYHYETLDKSKGDVDEAVRMFEGELDEFREITDIKTICMHGNPLASWTNRDMWERYDFKDFGIIGEPYLSINYTDVVYLTDTGRTWAGDKVSVKDVVDTPYDCGVSSTGGVIGLIRSERFSHICLLAHPNRWCDNFGLWLWELVWQNTKNIGKRGIVWYRR